MLYLGKESILKSPMRYTGSKTKLLSVLLPLFPDTVNTFLDLFAGGLSVSVNVTANKVIANDLSKPIMFLYKAFQKYSVEEVYTHIHSRVKEFNLESGNKDTFLNFRSFFNTQEAKHPLDLFVLSCYSFIHHIRFNRTNMFYNSNIGTGDFKEKKNLSSFIDKIKHLHLTSFDYLNHPEILNLTKDDFIYLDPPYLITSTTYTTAWKELQLKNLLELIDSLNDRGIRFGLSEVIEHRDKENKILKSWYKKYNSICFDKDYILTNKQYNRSDRIHTPSKEIYVTNVEI